MSRTHHRTFSLACAIAVAMVAAATAAASGPTIDDAASPGATTGAASIASPAPQNNRPVVDARPAPVVAAPAAAKAAAALPDAARPLGPAPISIGRGTQPLNAGVGASTFSEASWLRSAGALVAVVSLILVVGFLVRKFAPANGLLGKLGPRGRAPSGVLEVLGRYPVSRGSMLVLLKLDRRVLLVSQSTGRGGTAMQTLSELTDPTEVASILSKTATATQSAAFAGALAQIQGDADPHAAPKRRASPATAAQADPVVGVASFERPAAPRKTGTSKTTATKAAQRLPARFVPGFQPTDVDGATAAKTLRERLATMQRDESAAAAGRGLVA